MLTRNSNIQDLLAGEGCLYRVGAGISDDVWNAPEANKIGKLRKVQYGRETIFHVIHEPDDSKIAEVKIRQD